MLFFSSYSKCPSIDDLFEGLRLVGTHFSVLEPVPVLNKKNGYVTLFHCSWRPAWCQLCDIRAANACGIHSWLKKFGVLCLNDSYTLFVWGQKHVTLKSCKKRSPRALPLVYNNALRMFCRIKPRYTPGFVYDSLRVTFNCFLSFFRQSEALHSSILCPLYECLRTGKPPPPSTSHTMPHPQHTYLCERTALEGRQLPQKWVIGMFSYC